MTPTVDEESIKVEGIGSAIITDIATELLPNREIFQEIYPDSDDDDDSASDSEADSSDDEDAKRPLELVGVQSRMVTVRDDLKRAKEAISSADSRLSILDGYGKMLDKKKGVVIEDGIETYRNEREKVFEDHLKGQVRERLLNEELRELKKKEVRLLKVQRKEAEKVQKAKAKVQKAKDKEREKKQRRDEQRRNEKTRIRKERENFWPKFCYSVTITLDVAMYTPMSSRRTSIASEADLQLVKEKSTEKATPSGGEGSGSNTCDLLITYVTSSAHWSPSYDLQLLTTNNSATLCFDAQLTNATSETWSNAKITLSTSQTTFAGLEDALPTLVPWHVKLAGRGSGILENDILNSKEERTEQMGWEVAQRQQYQVHKPRANLFGASSLPEPTVNAKVVQAEMSRQKHAMAEQVRQHVENNYMTQNAFGAPPPPPAPQSMKMAMPMPRAARAGFGMAREKKKAVGFGGGGTQHWQTAPASEIAMYSASRDDQPRLSVGAPGGAAMALGGAAGDDGETDGSDGDDGTILEALPELDFQDSAMEETGLTTTYDLPGTKTLAPKTTASKQRVARLTFSNIIFSHTVVAKYKPAAYLKAKLKNNSKLTLLKGPAGLTLDGSFMGRTRLPRCSAGDSFFLSLGIDPAIRVLYPKPEVRRSTNGIFSKEDSSVYTRTVTIVNTKASGSTAKTASLLVLDQVPVSQDERLRVDILAPKGLSVGGNAVNAGVPAKENDKDWGKATAVLKKGGEVSWDLSLKAGKAVKLGLEYEVAAPAGEHVMQC